MAKTLKEVYNSLTLTEKRDIRCNWCYRKKRSDQSFAKMLLRTPSLTEMEELYELYNFTYSKRDGFGYDHARAQQKLFGLDEFVPIFNSKQS